MSNAPWIPASEVENYPIDRFDLFWNEDCTAFQAARLKWWDDRSYAAYQAGADLDDSYADYPQYTADDFDSDPVPAQVEPSLDDDILF